MIWLLNLDLMSSNFFFNINKNEKLKSKVGVILTFLWLICIVLAFIAFGKDIFEKKLPRVTFNMKNTPNNSLSFNSDNFMFAIYNSEDHSIVDYNSTFDILLEAFYNYPEGYDTYTYYFEFCKDSALNYFEKEFVPNKNRYLCLKSGTNIEINGGYQTGTFWSSRLLVNLCNANRTNCSSYEENSKKFNILGIHMLFKDHYTDTTNFKNPYVESIRSVSAFTSIDTWSRKIIWFKEIEIQTDQGWIIQSYNTTAKNTIDKVEETVIKKPGTMTLFSHQIINSVWKDVYLRSYIKIQDVAASIGGILNIVAILMKIVNSYLILPEFLFYFYSSINKSDNSSNSETQSNENKAQNIKIKSNINVSEIVKNQDEKKIKKYEKLQSNKQILDNSNLSKDDMSFNDSKNETKKVFPQKNNFFEDNKSNKIDDNSSKNKIYEIKSLTNEGLSKKIQCSYQRFSTYERIFRFCFCFKNIKIKNKMLNVVNDLYKKLFSLEVITDSYRKEEIIMHLLFDQAQKTIIEYLDLPNFKENSIKDFNSSKVNFIQNYVDTEVNQKIKALIENC